MRSRDMILNLGKPQYSNENSSDDYQQDVSKSFHLGDTTGYLLNGGLDVDEVISGDSGSDEKPKKRRSKTTNKKKTGAQ